MGETIKFRNLTKDEIEVRVGSSGSLLLYKTARVDANILDETVGCFNWQKRFYQVKNTMICEISINVNYKDATKEPIWVSKADGGDDDYTMEKVKAECSDSMKRAAFQWGIGRNLYTAPKIKIPEQFKNQQYFDVESIGYDENGTITDLVISTNFGKDIVFSYKNGRKVTQNGGNAPQSQQEQRGSIEKTDLTYIQAFINTIPSEQKRKEFYDWLERNYNTLNPEMLTKSQGKIIVATLKKKEGNR